MRRIKLVAPAIVFFIVIFLQALFAQEEWKFPIPKGKRIPGENLIMVPESERFMSFAVMGLWPNTSTYYFLPELKKKKGMTDAQLNEVREQFYWLNFELSHGRVIRNLPKYTQFYVALPDRKYVKESLGWEKKLFLQFLKEKCGFTDEDISHRFNFFKSEIQLEWAQDACKVLGREENGRVVIAYSKGDNNPYVGTMQNLANDFPEDFRLVEIDRNLSAEGGDEDIIWQPGGDVAFLAGRNRALEYFRRSRQESYEEQSLTKEMVEEARTAYSNAVFGTKVVFMPEKTLLDAKLRCRETFHLDMIATTLPDIKGKGFRAFVPSYTKEAYDALTFAPLDPEIMKGAQREFDLAAEQFKKMGYAVSRLYFSDHPVRGPVNIGRFRNKETGKYTVLLAKYPYHLPPGDPNCPQARINFILDKLNEETADWMENPNTQKYNEVVSWIDTMWRIMDEVALMPNPIYEAQKKVFTDLGYDVITIPMYAWGAGGLHCQLMY